MSVSVSSAIAYLDIAAKLDHIIITYSKLMPFNRPVCNCPDATQSQGKNLFASQQSLTFDRNWNNRVGAGGTTKPFPGIRDNGGYCEHELAVLIIRKELKLAFPDGIPYKPKIDVIEPRKRSSQKLESDYLYLAEVKPLDV